jgi:nucleoside-diphosphate-sugar epimerase
MKVVIAGSTGFVGQEVVRQALYHPLITKVVTLSRRDHDLAEDLRRPEFEEKFTSVSCSDFKSYPQYVKDEISGADACIWLIGVTPAKLKQYTWDQVRMICYEYALYAADTFAKLPREGKPEPLRFIYVSGSNAERDPAKKPWILGDYCLLRGQVEKQILERAHLSDGRMQVLVAKSGMVTDPDMGFVKQAFRFFSHAIVSVPSIGRAEVTAALLNQAVNGLSKETLLNAELTEIGNKELVRMENNHN